MAKFKDNSLIVQNLPVLAKTSKEAILNVFNDLHYRWREGMDITSYRKEKQTPIIVVMDTFFDDRLVEIGSQLVDKQKTTVNPWVLWMSCCEFNEYPSGCEVIARSDFYCDRAAKLFQDMMAEHLGKKVIFTHSRLVKQRVEGI